MPTDDLSPSAAAQIMRAVNAVLVELKDMRQDVTSLNLNLFGGKGPDGKRIEGLMGDVEDIDRRVTALEAQRTQGTERRWLIYSGGLGAAIAKGFDMIAQYFQSKGGTH